jgi:hypothetical protein
VIGRLMGLPEEDLPQIHRWAEMSTSSQDSDNAIDEVGAVADNVGDVVFGRKNPNWRAGLQTPEQAIKIALREGAQIASRIR